MKRLRSPEELLKHESVAKARDAIRSLQEQIADRLLKINAQVEKLSAHLDTRKTLHFLHASCELDLTDAAAFTKASVLLKGQEDLLRKKRIGFALLRSLAGADEETRNESLARMEAGATVGTKDVAAIRAEFRISKLSFSEISARAAMRRTKAAATRRTTECLKTIDRQVGEILTKVDMLQSRLPEDVRVEFTTIARSMASEVLPLFEQVWGEQPASVREVLALPMGSDGRAVGLAHLALTKIALGEFDGKHGFALDNTSETGRVRTDLIQCLQGVTTVKPPLDFGSPLSKKPVTRIPKPNLTVVELCAGAGGMAIGLERAGFHPLALVEFDKNAAATLRRNRPLWSVIERDIRNIDFKPYRSRGVDLLVGGLPCQPYSIEGQGLGKNDPRDLLMEGVRAVEEMRPAAFAFENVVGLLNARHADHLGDFLRKLRKAGYAVQIVRMEAEDYGVPQERSRILIVGIQKSAIGTFRAPPKFPLWRTNMGDALEKLMGENGWTGAAAWAEAIRSQIVERNGIKFRGALASTVVGRKGGARDKEMARWAKKGIDIRNVGDAAPTQEEADRAGPNFLPSLTLRMRARLQAFPDDWTFIGGKDSAARQIGNAVPPPIGTALGLAIRTALRGNVLDYEVLMHPDAVHEEEESARLLLEAPSLELNLSFERSRDLVGQQ
ncbi:DNA (cytosine-5-)-methyltransferase [Rhizobium sp. SIMBA_035]